MPMEETMTISLFENDPKRINALEEMEIMKATTSRTLSRTSTRSTECYNQFMIRQRPAQTIAEDATWMAKALHVLHRF